MGGRLLFAIGTGGGRIPEPLMCFPERRAGLDDGGKVAGPAAAQRVDEADVLLIDEGVWSEHVPLDGDDAERARHRGEQIRFD